MAVGLVLTARTVNVPPRPPGTNSARSMLTTSGGGGGAVVTVNVGDPLPSPPQQATAFTVTGVLAATRLVVTGNHATLVLAATTICAGTWTMAGLALVRLTRAPCVASPLMVTLPVAGPVPPRLGGENTTDANGGPAGAGPVPPRLGGKNTTDAIDGPVGAGCVVTLAALVVPPAAASISAKFTVAVTDVVIVNVALATPAGTRTVAGTAATAGFVLESVTGVSPPIAEASVTVPCRDWPPTTRDWERVSETSCLPDGAGCTTVTSADCVRPPNEPEMRTETGKATVCPVTANVAVVAPAGTVTLAGTVATVASALDSATAAPPAGGAAGAVTVPVTVFPPLTDVADSVSAASDTAPGAGLTFNTAVCVTWPAVAEIAAKSGAATVCDVTVNVVLVLPAGTVTFGGTVAAATLLLLTPTAVPPAGAAPVSVTVAVALVPLLTVVGGVGRA